MYAGPFVSCNAGAFLDIEGKLHIVLTVEPCSNQLFQLPQEFHIS